MIQQQLVDFAGALDRRGMAGVGELEESRAWNALRKCASETRRRDGIVRRADHQVGTPASWWSEPAALYAAIALSCFITIGG